MSKTTQAKKQAKVEGLKKVEDQKAPEVEVKSETVQETTPVTSETVEPIAENAKVRQAKVRGKKYKAAKAKIDVTKYYPLKEAVKLTKETSIGKFVGKIEAHVTVMDVGTVGEITFPHLEMASKKIVITDESVVAAIKEGKIDFDILIATPATMPKLLPFARLLGPKGLMPNPKNGTLTDKPEEAVKKLSIAKLVIKTETKAPVIHLVELIKTISPSKIRKLALCATMGPSVKVEIVK